MSNNKPYKDIVGDTAGAKRGEMPDHLVDVYGNKAPEAAKFNVGTSTQQGAQEAADARRQVPPGAYDHKR
jgi:hypothetical protein